MRILIVVSGLVVGTIPRACVPPHDKYEFCDASKPLEERVNDLIGRLSLEEKPYLLVARESPKGNISRLGVPEYDWGGNCIHGVQSRCSADGTCPTSFPNPNTLGATFNRSVWEGMGKVIGLELRALWLQGVGENHESNLPHIGLDCWSPNINIVRDPRWGRNLETPGEDPFLCGQFGAKVTSGLQGGTLDPRYLQAVVTLKHFDANSLEGPWGEFGQINRHTVNANLTMYDLHSTYLPAFKTAVEDGGALGVMCSYNAVNGVPTCASEYLLKEVLREDWGFEGYVTSDSGAVEDVMKNHHYTKNWDDTVSATLQAGCDMESAPWPKDHPWATDGPYISYIPSAVKAGLLAETDVDEALRHTLMLRFRLGLFDPIDDQPYWHVDPSVVRQQEHEDLAIDSTRQGLVLLKNDEKLGLPFQAGKKVAVIGPHANDNTAILGNYLGQMCPTFGSNDCVQTPCDAITKLNAADGGSTVCVEGVKVNSANVSGIGAAVAAAKAADYVVYIGGLDGSIEAEGKDRHDIGLPGSQPALLKALTGLNKFLVTVLYHGGIIAMPKADVAAVPSVVSAGYPGFYGARVMAEALFDTKAAEAPNRFGRLAVSWFLQEEWEAGNYDMLDFAMTAGKGRTYRYYKDDQELALPFGFGLSYSKFGVTASGSGNKVVARVANSGRAGDAVVLLYIRPQTGTVPSKEPAARLVRQLADFARVAVDKDGEAQVEFHLTSKSVELFNEDGKVQVFEGGYDVILSCGDKGAEATVPIHCNKHGCTVDSVVVV